MNGERVLRFRYKPQCLGINISFHWWKSRPREEGSFSKESSQLLAIELIHTSSYATLKGGSALYPTCLSFQPRSFFISFSVTIEALFPLLRVIVSKFLHPYPSYYYSRQHHINPCSPWPPAYKRSPICLLLTGD